MFCDEICCFNFNWNRGSPFWLLYGTSFSLMPKHPLETFRFYKTSCIFSIDILIWDKGKGKGVSHRIFIPSGNCRRQSSWAVVCSRVASSFLPTRSVPQFGPTMKCAECPQLRCSFGAFCFLKSFFCCFTTQQSGCDHPNHPPYTVDRSNRLLLLGHRNTPLAKHQRPIRSNPGIELGPPRWKAVRY